jgi:hypothetical protein
MRYRRQFESALAPDSSAQRKAKLAKQFCLGGAYIHAFGIGHVASIVNLRDDPNLRGNPRSINPTHVDNLFRVFKTPGAKRDHESPIILMMPKSIIDPECLKRISSVDPHNPASDVPPLIITHDNITEERSLEQQLWSHVRDGRWLDEEELKSVEARLQVLRNAHPLATLLNGNHRIQAILRVGQEIQWEHDALLKRARLGTVSREELQRNTQERFARAVLATYRVEVYNGRLINAWDPKVYIGSSTFSRWDAN